MRNADKKEEEVEEKKKEEEEVAKETPAKETAEKAEKTKVRIGTHKTSTDPGLVLLYSLFNAASVLLNCLFRTHK